LDSIDDEILKEVERRGRVTPSELARTLKWSKAMIWRRLKKLESMGLLRSAKMGGVIIYELALPPSPQGLFRLGILRASEYPYILPFIKKLNSLYSRVEVLVYDEAFKLASELARGRLHAAMIPAVTALLVHRASGGSIYIVGGGSRGGAGIIVGPGSTGHATSMASTMELCAVAEKLPEPRIYASSGDEILRLVMEGKVKYGVVWEPYLTQAVARGLKVLDCNVPVCCLFTIHRSLTDQSDRLARIFSDAVDYALKKSIDLDAYSKLVGLDYYLVMRSVRKYEFLNEPPVEDLKRAWSIIREAALPEDTISRSIRIYTSNPI
jgi:predicted transcriptional regulator